MVLHLRWKLSGFACFHWFEFSRGNGAVWIREKAGICCHWPLDGQCFRPFRSNGPDVFACHWHAAAAAAKKGINGLHSNAYVVTRWIIHLGSLDSTTWLGQKRGVVHSQKGCTDFKSSNKIFGFFPGFWGFFRIFSEKNLWIFWGDFSDFSWFSWFFRIWGIFRIFLDFFGVYDYFMNKRTI